MKLQSLERLSDLPYVRWIRKYQAFQDGSYTTYADGGIDLVVLRNTEGTRFLISGPTTKARVIEYKQGTEALVISLKTSIYMPNLLPKNLLDIDRCLPQANRQSFWLQNNAWRYPSFENADSFVSSLIQKDVLQYDNLIANVLAGRSTGLNIRSIQRRFRHVTGLTPHYLYQIQRAERAETLLAQGLPIGQTVFEAGYGDQPSMTHALKYFIGRTPGQISRDPDGWR